MRRRTSTTIAATTALALMIPFVSADRAEARHWGWGGGWGWGIGAGIATALILGGASIAIITITGTTGPGIRTTVIDTIGRGMP